MNLNKYSPSKETLHVAFMLGVLLIFAYALYLTRSFDRENSGTFPIIVLTVGILLILVDVARHAFRMSKSERADERQEEDESSSQVNSGFKHSLSTEEVEMSIGRAFRSFAWIVAYIASVFVIGFFTSSIVFAILFDVINSNGRSPRELASSVGWSLAIAASMWVLFIEVLHLSSVLRIGILP